MTSSASATIGVTGSTGQLGGAVAARLAAAGVSQRLIVRDPSRAPELTGATVAQASYDDGSAVEAALAGLDTVLMVSASEAPDRVSEHRSFIDAAVRAGVGHLVYTSFVGAGRASTFTLGRDHGATEDHLRASGLSVTLLRDNLYADFLAFMVGDDGVIRGPGGDGRLAAVAREDVADVATAVLLSPGDHVGATYRLTGPEALTFNEIAQTITDVTGRPVTYYDETLDEAYASRASYGAPDWQVEAWVSTYTGVAAGEFEQVSPDIETITGHPATSLAELLQRG
jgi:NAD(P)H dehydrogenase (quinone)